MSAPTSPDGAARLLAIQERALAKLQDQAAPIDGPQAVEVLREFCRDLAAECADFCAVHFLPDAVADPERAEALIEGSLEGLVDHLKATVVRICADAGVPAGGLEDLTFTAARDGFWQRMEVIVRSMVGLGIGGVQ